MDNYLLIPELNPLFFVDKDRSILPQYHTKFSDQFLDEESRKKWQGYGRYFQKWQTNDIIELQFMSNVAPITINLYNCKGLRARAPLIFTQKQRNRFIPEVFIYEASLALNGLPRGRYQAEITIGDPVVATLQTDWLDIAEDWPDSVLMEFTNSFYYGDTIFGTGYSPSFRVEGWFKKLPPSSKDEIYTDQVLNQRMIYSDPFSVQKFIIGPTIGVPDWTPEKLNWILGCDELFIDGKAFAKADGAKWEEEEVDGHPFRGYAINLQEQNRRASRIFPIDPTTGGKKLLVALNVETEGFADTTTGASSNVIQISSVET